MFKVVVTGATGFIGKHLCKHLLEKGVVVYGVGRNQKVLDELCEFPNFYPVKLEFEEYSQIEKIITDRDFDLFFHLAHYGVNGADKSNFRIQLNNTMLACDAVNTAYTLGCRRFVYAGSVDEFEVGGRPDETFVYPTHSRIYGMAKYAAESIGKVLAMKCNIEYVTAVFPLTFGEGNNTNILPNVIIKKSFESKPVSLIEGKNYYDIIYVEEAVKGLMAVAENGKNLESYYVGHRTLRTFREIVENICAIIGSQSKLEFGQYQDTGCTIDYSVINRDKLYKDTGYMCDEQLEKGVIRTYNWMKEQFKL